MRFVCFGELLLRLAAPRRELLLQSPSLEVCGGGAEANVAVSLACFGHEAAVVSAVPDNALGEACRAELRRRRVETRLGAGAFEWPKILAGADCLHVSGVTPALGARSAELAQEALEAARRAGVRVSFDCNFRPTLWQAWDGDAAGILARLAALADLLFADERTLALLSPSERQAASATDPFAALSAAARARFSSVSKIATSTRLEKDVDHHVLGARCAERGGGVVTVEPRAVSSIVDRIGSGDAFAAGFLHGLATGRAASDALAFAV